MANFQHIWKCGNVCQPDWGFIIIGLQFMLWSNLGTTLHPEKWCIDTHAYICIYVCMWFSVVLDNEGQLGPASSSISAQCLWHGVQRFNCETEYLILSCVLLWVSSSVLYSHTIGDGYCVPVAFVRIRSVWVAFWNWSHRILTFLSVLDLFNWGHVVIHAK